MSEGPPRKLIEITLVCFICVISAALFFTKTHHQDPISLNTKDQPTIGYTNARVHLVLFEEPKCSSCKEYNEEIFPKIKEEFIDSNQVSYTVIPVSFLSGSMPAAESMLCVYYADPLYPNSDLFFTYLDYLYKHQPKESTDWAHTDLLVRFAGEASPAINVKQLRACVDSASYRKKIEKNTEYGKTVMNGLLMTPTLYINGIRVDELTYSTISDLIKEQLEEKGVSQ